MEIEKTALQRLVDGLFFFDMYHDDDMELWLACFENLNAPVSEIKRPLPTKLEPPALMHRIILGEDYDDGWEWGWENTSCITTQTLFFLDDILKYDRAEIVGDLKQVPNGIDWLSKLYGVVWSHVSQATYDNETPKIDTEAVRRALLPFAFFFIAQCGTMRNKALPGTVAVGKSEIRKLMGGIDLRTVKKRLSQMNIPFEDNGQTFVLSSTDLVVLKNTVL